MFLDLPHRPEPATGSSRNRRARHPHLTTWAAGWTVITILLTGCGDSGPPPTAPLRVAAASDLQKALPVILSRFQLDTGIQSEPIFGSSSQLAQQIRQGGPFDVFLSANRAFVQDLAKDGAVAEASVRPYAKGSVVVAVNKKAAGGVVKALDDLKSPGIKKIALANPKLAPYGLAGKQVLERSGLWEAVEPKIVYADTVRQALTYVESGECEAAFIGKALVGDSGLEVVPIDPAKYDPILQYLGVVKRDGSHPDAVRFCDFLRGPVGQGMLREFGFSGVE